MKKTTIKIPKVKYRITWAFSPITRVVKSKKAYDRNKCKVTKYI